MTAIRGYVPPTDRKGALGVHSLDEFVFAVPDLGKARHFYANFGLDVRERDNTLTLGTFGHDHRWGSVIEGPNKRLHHLSFGCYAEDFPTFKARLEGDGVALVDPPPGFESNGLWFRDWQNVLIELKVAPKSTLDRKSVAEWTSAPEGAAGATVRAKAPTVRPRRLSHVLMFTSDIDRSVEFYVRHLGLKLSDRAADIVAFMHGIHGSDHHILAFVKGSGPGLHHSSWDTGNINDIGLGAMNMADKGYTKGWGLGRHVLGSNYFHYVRDPWGSYAEYSCDIDYIPSTQDWEAGSHNPEDSFYLWGPEVPEEFAINHEKW